MSLTATLRTIFAVLLAITAPAAILANAWEPLLGVGLVAVCFEAINFGNWLSERGTQ